MTHRTALATIRTLARQAGSTAGRTATTVAREVRGRIAQRRAAPVHASPPDSPPPAPPAPPPVAAVAVEEPAVRRTPSPADVARAVARNTTGLVRATPTSARPVPVNGSAPGGKLPFRSVRAT